LFVPKDGILAGVRVAVRRCRRRHRERARRLLAIPARAAGVLGAIGHRRHVAADRRGERQARARPQERRRDESRVPRRARALAAGRGGRRSRSRRFEREAFGPIAFIIRTADTQESLRLATGEARKSGAITAIVHTTDAAVLEQAQRWAQDGKVKPRGELDRAAAGQPVGRVQRFPT